MRKNIYIIFLSIVIFYGNLNFLYAGVGGGGPNNSGNDGAGGCTTTCWDVMYYEYELVPGTPGEDSSFGSVTAYKGNLNNDDGGTSGGYITFGQSLGGYVDYSSVGLGATCWDSSYAGGDGGRLYGIVNVTPGQTISIRVGDGGDAGVGNYRTGSDGRRGVVAIWY